MDAIRRLARKVGALLWLDEEGRGDQVVLLRTALGLLRPAPKTDTLRCRIRADHGSAPIRGLGEQWPVGPVVREATDRSVCRTSSGAGAKKRARKGHPGGPAVFAKNEKISKSHPKPAWPKVGRRSPEGRWLPGRGSL